MRLSIALTHSRACSLVFLQWPNKTRQLYSRIFVARCFSALAFYFGQVAKAFYYLCCHF